LDLGDRIGERRRASGQRLRLSILRPPGSRSGAGRARRSSLVVLLVLVPHVLSALALVSAAASPGSSPSAKTADDEHGRQAGGSPPVIEQVDVLASESRRMSRQAVS
jgi:hypothetical protein